MKDNKFSLVIVDVQKDFYDSSGALYVNGAEKLPPKIYEFIHKNHDVIGEIIYTLDWHNPDNESFKENGGPWPSHCVKGTWGVNPAYPIEFVANKYNIPLRFYKKGQVIDEYGAFPHYYRNNEENTMYGENWPDYKENLITTKYEKFIVCGLCGDYCVLETIKNLKKIPGVEVYAATDLILSIDNGAKFWKWVDENTKQLEYLKVFGDYELLKI